MSSLYNRMGEFNETYYLMQNRDVHEAVNNGDFASGEQHFTLYGGKELRNPNALFDIEYYSAQNPDVRAAVTSGDFNNAFEHFVLYGLAEGRVPSAEYADFDEETYLNARGNEDIREAYENGDVPSGFWHYVMYGEAEGRGGYSSHVDPPSDDPATSFTLTQRVDNITGNNLDNTFLAPVTQNETGSGELANTFETGDVLNGGGGRNVLRADLIGTGTIQDGVASAPISATTTNIQEVYLRAQMPNAPQTTIDAEKMSGVEQWWTVNSRNVVVIEDIRSATVDTTFGMRLTDPRVDYAAFFNSLFMQGDIDSESALTLRIQDITDGQDPSATELQHISVREINFDHEGVSYTLSSEAMRAANTWAQLQAAVATELAGHGLDTLSVSHAGNGVFVISDSAGGVFEVQQGEALILGVDSDRDVRNRVDVGRVVEEGPTITNVILDGVGNGSQGGVLNIGAMSGLRGVEVFDVTVDRNSHLAVMESTNLNGPVTVLVPNEFLQVVNLASTGANGDLQIGARTNTLDGRAAIGGLYNVLEVNGANFQGALNIGIQLDGNAAVRYLDPATEPVNFRYTAGANNDIFNIQDTTGGVVSGDADFAMQVNMGAGDDRLIINVPIVRNVSVAGGSGENSIVVSNSHGTTAANTFNSFSGFQTYEVEGGANTVHNFASMSGVQNVVIATLGGADTRLRNLEAGQHVTISGKNQTITPTSTADQFFGDITLTDDAGVSRTVTLENTARLSNLNAAGDRIDGRMFVNALIIDQDTGVSATRTVTVVSDGGRNTANFVNDFQGARVTTLNLEGTQDLSFHVSNMATLPVTAGVTPALAITGANLGTSEAPADLTLALNSAVLARGNLDVVTGAGGEGDVLQLYGANPGAATISGFETIQFGEPFFNAGFTFAGTFNATNTTGVELYDFQNLAGATTLTNLRGTVNAFVDALNANQNLTFTAASQATGNVLNIEFGDDLNVGATYGNTLATNDFRTVNVTLTGSANFDDNFTFTVNPNNYARALTFEGGGDRGAAGIVGGVDELNLVAPLNNWLTTIDFSGFVGRVGDTTTIQLNHDAAAGNNTTVLVNGYGFDFQDNANPATDSVITTFRFTTDAVAATEDWTITGFRAFNDPAVGLDNLSVLDMRDLGVTGLADIVITDVGADVTITSNTGLDFEITLTGVNSVDLSNENFEFA